MNYALSSISFDAGSLKHDMFENALPSAVLDKTGHL